MSPGAAAASASIATPTRADRCSISNPTTEPSPASCQLRCPACSATTATSSLNAGFGIRTFHDVEFFGQLNNLLDQKYEEVLGYPSYRLNFMAGIRLNFSSESLAPKRP